MIAPDFPQATSGGDLSVFGLAGARVVVTGAGSGIGRAAAVLFAQAGADLVLADINVDAVEASGDLVRAHGREALIVPTDCACPAAIDALAEQAAAAGPIRGWCNVAGAVAKQTVVDTDPADYARMLDLNLGGTFWGCRAAARRMIPHGGGAIVNISSNAADEPIGGLALYSMTKAGVNMLTRTLAHELGPSGIRVNAVAPGFTLTGMTAPVGTDLDAVVARNAARSPLGRVGSPDDIAFAMLYLLSDASRFVTGQIWRVNGGVTMP
ncbi:SDR family NAD(P)-dependent oxidoreductase [Sphingomonas sp. BAUL-RG-20F-R05-02]|uniref:SDR family NAD(P)-dependent oxidoreductase n=1 Tax=Sphingomonas sp. BAUL-RG-20F-R05-02 TaxID=2914830 RepID=UPI001F57B2F6|nr:SDR family oxidoreductase [Sphingomonas sp. BAUL-RG-20F-R05-02]